MFGISPNPTLSSFWRAACLPKYTVVQAAPPKNDRGFVAVWGELEDGQVGCRTTVIMINTFDSKLLLFFL